MSFHATDAGFSARTIRLSTFRKHLMSGVCAALIIAAAGPSAHAQQVPGKYFKADGSKTNDYEAAKKSWLDDKEFQGDWGLKAIHAEGAYARGITGRGMVAGVLDSGTLEAHPKFSGPGKFISIHAQGNRAYIDDYTAAGTWLIPNPPIHVGDYFDFYGGIPVVNDAHGTHTGGTIAARREGGQGTMQGVAFDATLAAANGTEMGPYVGTIDTFDSSIFAAAIDGFVEAKVPVVNNSWGIGPATLDGRLNTTSNGGASPFNFGKDVIPQYVNDPTKRMFDIAEDAVKKHDMQFVFAAGNNGPGATPDAMVSLPYFRPELEGHWLSVTGIGQTGIPIPGYSDYKIYAGSSRCEQTKWYCITAPAVGVKSSFFEYDKQSGGLTPTFDNDTGNSMAAPHVTGAMTLIMQRFNYLNSVAAHDILLTTATYLPDGSGNDKLNIAGSRTQIPNERSGWGLVNLENSMNGPGQFLGRIEANLNTGVNDVWRNDISDLALNQRKIDEQTEMSSWTDRKKAQGWENGVPQSRRLTVEAATKADLDKMGSLFTSLFTTSVARLNNSLEVKNAYGAVEADANAKRFRDNFIKADPYAFGRPNLQELYEAYKLTTIRAEIAAAKPADKDSLEKSAGLFGAFVEKLVGGQKAMADYLMIFNTVNTNPVTLPLILKYQKQNPKWWESADALKNYGVFKTEVLDPLFAVHMHGAFDAVVAEYTVSEARTAYLTKKLADPSAYLGGLTKSGAGSLWLTGKNSYRGNTIVNGGELGIGAGGSIISAAIINNTGLLTVDGKTAAVTANPGGRLKVNAPGVTGAVTLNGGFASVDGTSGATEINAGGELGGIGTVGSLAVHAGGMVSPGNSIGTLHVAGPANFDKATGLTIQVAADGRSDRLDVKGKATLLGGVLIVAPQSSKAPLSPAETLALLGKTYTVLTAEKGITGRFEAATPDYYFIGASLAYAQSDVKVSLGRNGVAFADAGKTENQKAAATGVESLGHGNPLYDTIAVTTLGDNLPEHFDALSGEVHASLQAVLVEDSRFVRDAAANRIRAAFGNMAGGKAAAPVLAYGPDQKKGAAGDAFVPLLPAVPTTALWGEAYGSRSHADRTSNASAYSRNTGGFVTGFDGVIADTWRFGLLAGYGNTSVNTARGRASADSYQVGVYGGTRIDALTLSLGTSLAHHEIDTRRKVVFSGINDSNTADYSANTVQLFGEAAYRIDTAYAAFEPFAAAAYTHLKTAGFTETGGITALSGQSDTTDLTTTTLGLRASHRFAVSEATVLTAHGMAGWRHAFGDTTPEASLAFASGGQAFAVSGSPIASDTALVEAGLDFGIGKATTLGVSYNGQFSSQSHDNAVKADLTVRF